MSRSTRHVAAFMVGRVEDLMCVGPQIGLDTCLAKLMSIYPGLERSSWRTMHYRNGTCEAPVEWETPGLIDEYDVTSHLKAQVMCKEEAVKYRRSELANKKVEQLYKVSSPSLDDHLFKQEELESVGELSEVCSQIVLKSSYLARIGRPDILWSVNKLTGSATK